MEPWQNPGRKALALGWLAAAAGALALLPARSTPPPAGSPAEVPPPAFSRPRWIEVRVDPRSFPRDAHAEQGERLYGWNCLPCHGPEGRGDGPVAVRLGLRPRDFTRGCFKLRTSGPDEMPFDEDLYRSISTGFPGGAMPAFGDFTAEERWSLVDLVRSLSFRSGPEGRVTRWFDAYPAREAAPPPPDFAAGSVSRGAKLFREEIGCVQCHGARGRGDGPQAALLRDAEDRPETLPNFAQGRLSFKAGDAPADVYRVLGSGLDGTAMPSFRSLAVADRRDLALFVTSLYERTPPGEELFLTRGCLQCHTLGHGRRAGPDLAGVGRRRDRGWIRRWLEDPPGMLRDDPQAQALAREYPIPMPDLRLSGSDVGALVEYLASLPEPGSP